jgi:GGDEF domain-containing protein
MGGEEFAVMAATAGPQPGLCWLNGCVSRLRSIFFTGNQTLRLTVSIGVSNGQVLSGSLTEAFNKLLAEADEYLYRSKKRGEIAPVCVSRQWKNIKILGRFLTAEWPVRQRAFALLEGKTIAISY